MSHINKVKSLKSDVFIYTTFYVIFVCVITRILESQG